MTVKTAVQTADQMTVQTARRLDGRLDSRLLDRLEHREACQLDGQQSASGNKRWQKDTQIESVKLSQVWAKEMLADACCEFASPPNPPISMMMLHVGRMINHDKREHLFRPAEALRHKSKPQH